MLEFYSTCIDVTKHVWTLPNMYEFYKTYQNFAKKTCMILDSLPTI